MYGLKVVPFREASNFQSSLRDFSSLESLPRTASWAKFSRPYGTHPAILSSHLDTEARFSLLLYGPPKVVP
jgi:hypothetical protein